MPRAWAAWQQRLQRVDRALLDALPAVGRTCWQTVITFCLVLGFTRSGRPLHIQCSYPSRPLIKLITLYEPKPDEWIDFSVRRER